MSLQQFEATAALAQERYDSPDGTILGIILDGYKLELIFDQDDSFVCDALECLDSTVLTLEGFLALLSDSVSTESLEAFANENETVVFIGSNLNAHFRTEDRSGCWILEVITTNNPTFVATRETIRSYMQPLKLAHLLPC